MKPATDSPATDVLVKTVLVVGGILTVTWIIALVIILGCLLGDLLYVIGGAAIALFGYAAGAPPAIRHIGPERISSREVLAALRRRS